LLKYTVKLNKYMEAPEERMESAHFSPPLSKQRNEFARNIIKALEPKFLVDLGCGSGSLLEAILEQPLGLEHIAGVDTSHKGLIRAAKVKRPSPVCVHSFFQKFA
jgi:trans-aconitate methyltransferase